MLILVLSHELNVSISALCKRFGISRSSFYYQKRDNSHDKHLVSLIKGIFEDSEEVYGTRKIKAELSTQGHKTSRRKISQIMNQEDLVSVYTKPSSLPLNTQSVRAESQNLVKQEFDNRDDREVIVSDTSYLRINGQWNYLCIMLDLCGRNLDGFAVSNRKDATLSKNAFFSIKGDLRDIGILHTDKGSEYVNKLMEKTLRAFDIQHSTSRKGNPCDNAVAESMFKIIKTEFVRKRTFASLEDFNQKFSKWAKKYNNVRIHGSLGYLTPAEFRRRSKEMHMNNLHKECVAF
jgi:transposase InsO family protein